MVYGLEKNLYSFVYQSMHEFSSQLQGRIFSSFTESLNSDRMMQVAKVIVSIAIVIIAIAACAHCCQYEEITIEYSDIPTSSKSAEKTKEAAKDVFTPSTEPSLETSLPDSFPLPVEVPLIPKPVGAKKQYELPIIDDVTTLNLIDDVTKAQLNQKLMKAYELISVVNNICFFGLVKSNDSIKRDINSLGSFDSEAQKYEEIAIKLHKSWNDCKSDYALHKFTINKDDLNDLLIQAEQDHLSLVFVALCQKYFNEGNFDQCATIAKMISLYRIPMKDTVAIALCQHYIHQSEFDKALTQLHECHLNDQKDTLLLHIAKAFFNRGDYAQALKSSYSLNTTEKDEFILNIGRIHFENNELDKAYPIAKHLSYTNENREEFIIDIAKAYIKQTPPDIDKALKISKELFSSTDKEELMIAIIKKHLSQGDLEKALTIIKNEIYGLKRDEWSFIIAKAYFNQGDWEKAAKVARDMYYSEERDDFIRAIAKKYLSIDDRETALKIAKNLPYGKETEKLIQQIKQQATI